MAKEKIEQKETLIKVHNILRIDESKYGKSQFWEIIGVYLGALGQESLVQVRSLSKTPNDEMGTPYIPCGLLEKGIKDQTIRVLIPAKNTLYKHDE